MKNQIIVFIFLLTSVIVKSQIKEESVCTKGQDSIVISQDKRTAVDIKLYCGAPKKKDFLYVLDGVPILCDSIGSTLSNLDVKNIKNIEVIKEADHAIFNCFGIRKDCILITTKDKIEENQLDITDLPFKIYDVNTENFNTQQDVYNAIRAKVPNVQITNTQLQETPRITMRGDDNTIVIIDGIRTTVAALHALNPSDIETIKVSNNPAAVNYLRTTNN